MAITTNNLISRQTVGSAGAATVTFSNIPQTFTDLRVVISSRVDYTGAWQNINIELNGDSGSNYTSKLLYGNGSAAGSDTTTTTFLKFVYSNFNTSTASVFSNGEMYFPNYRSATYKSVSSDSVTENNATTVLTALTAGIWNSTAAITTIKFTPNQGSFGEFTTFSLYGVSSNTSTQNTSVPSATGGDVITTDGTYWYHTFKYSGTFTPLKALTADYLVVAGGGGGYYGNNPVNNPSTWNGGGGAGGYRTAASQSFVSATNYAITIGAGGAKGDPASNGSTSSLIGGAISYSASGGGACAGSNGGAGSSGGSGGGGGGASNGAGGTGNSGSYSPVEGYAGGAGGATYGGGGGGSAGVGTSGTTGNNAAGGAGTSNSISGSAVTYAAGGRGGSLTFGAGTANTGNGANAAQSTTYNNNGGSGIVIVRYAV